jgi:hypothetical protein
MIEEIKDEIKRWQTGRIIRIRRGGMRDDRKREYSGD